MEEPRPSTSKINEEIEEFPDINPEPVTKFKKPNVSPGAIKLRNWLNKYMRISMSDGRILIGIFLCTDRDANIILGSCSEYLSEETTSNGSVPPEGDEPRMLGLVMVPGKHIVNISVDLNDQTVKNWGSEELLPQGVNVADPGIEWLLPDVDNLNLNKVDSGTKPTSQNSKADLDCMSEPIPPDVSSDDVT